jgi:hypothetical protein
MIALVVGVIALILSNLRHHAIEQSKQQLLATATVLARQAARDFRSIDLIDANRSSPTNSMPAPRSDAAST